MFITFLGQIIYRHFVEITASFCIPLFPYVPLRMGRGTFWRREYVRYWKRNNISELIIAKTASQCTTNKELLASLCRSVSSPSRECPVN